MKTYSEKHMHMVQFEFGKKLFALPGKPINPLEGSKKTSKEDEDKSSKMEIKSGGSNELPFAI